MMQTVLKGKGKNNDIIVLRLLVKYGAITISQMAKLDGLDQSYPAPRERKKLYRRALEGRNDSPDPALLELGLANKDRRMIDGKATEVYSITESGVGELLKAEVFERAKNYPEELLEGEGIDKIVKVAHEKRIDPIELIPNVRFLTNKTSVEIVEAAVQEFPYKEEFAKFVRWFEERCPQSYSEWRAKRLKLDKFLMQADPELIEEVKRNFPLHSKLWGM